MSQVYDAIVVGAGIEGSSTAYHLVKNGQHTLLLEQFPLPHSRGSSHGHSRITRKAYGRKDYYTEMMYEAYQMWADLEKESETTLFKQTGVLLVGNDGDEIIEGTIRGLRKYSLPFRDLDFQALKNKYPMLKYSDTYKGVEDLSGGILFADKALAAFQNQFIKHGGTLRENEKVVNVHPEPEVVVRTNKGIYKGRNVVLTVGPWATKMLLPLGVELPLTVTRTSAFYWEEKTPGMFAAGKFPAFIQDHGHGKLHVYGIPSLEYPGLYKLCSHYGPEIDPDKRDIPSNAKILEDMKRFVSEHFPNLKPHPSITEACIYTSTPDRDFVLDRHPAWKNIIIGAGFSGHGFKLSPVVGKLLSELVMNKAPSYDMTHFRINRFYVSSKL